MKDYVQVLNPSIRLNWIRKHWEPRYIDHAENVIKEIVCLYF
jgi:hypothetical protein